MAQSLLMKNPLILEELKWFNLVNGSGNLPSLLQVTCLSTETELKLSCFQVGVKKRHMKLKKERLFNGTSLVVARGPLRQMALAKSSS